MHKKKILIIGGDSRLSKFLVPILQKKFICILTSRKYKKNFLYLDLEKVSNFTIPKNIYCAVIIAGIVDYDTNENNPRLSYNVNCIQVPKLISKLLHNDSKVLYISTNTVFKSRSKKQDEYCKTNPGFNYPRFKNIAEKKIIKIANSANKEKKLSILRLTKNIDFLSNPFKDWIRCFSTNKKIVAFKDLYFAPILYSDSAKFILTLVMKNVFGIFHLSGSKDISYYKFALSLEKKLKLKKIVYGCYSKTKGIKLVYNHKITGLNMRRTTFLTGQRPIPLKSVLDFFCKKINSKT